MDHRYSLPDIGVDFVPRFRVAATIEKVVLLRFWRRRPVLITRRESSIDEMTLSTNDLQYEARLVERPRASPVVPSVLQEN